MGDKSFDDEDFTLPSEFLTEEIMLMDKENFHKNKLNSPLSPELATESQCYDANPFFTDLTRRLARSTLLQTQKTPFSVAPSIPEKTWANGIPDGRSLVPMPPIAPIGRNINYWQKMNNQGHTRNFTQINPSNRAYNHQQVYQNKGPKAAGFFGGERYDVTPGIGWPRPQVQNPKQYQNRRPSDGGVDLRSAVYGGRSGGGGLKRECAGTGVFLPRRYTPVSRKKSGCSTTLPPPRVVQAQTNNFENVMPQIEAQPHLNDGGHISENEILTARRNAVNTEDGRKHNVMSSEARLNDLRLPQEWTY